MIRRYKLPDPTTTAVTLAGHEYKARDGVLDVPTSHEEAHAAALAIGLTPVQDAGKPE